MAGKEVKCKNCGHGVARHVDRQKWCTAGVCVCSKFIAPDSPEETFKSLWLLAQQSVSSPVEAFVQGYKITIERV